MFNSEPLSEYLDRHKENLRREIKSSKDILQYSVGEYKRSLIKKYSLYTPILKDTDIRYKTDEEFSERMGRSSYYIIIIPFEGNHQLFNLTPSTRQYNPPYGEVSKDEIQLRYKLTSYNRDDILRDYSNNLKRIKKYLVWIDKDIKKHNEWVKNNVSELIMKRKEELKGESDFFKSLGINQLKEEKHVDRTELQEIIVNGRTHEKYEYDAFISHASEDKESFVSEFAAELSDRGVKIWYDDFTLTIGDSLRRSIDRGLVSSQYGIVVLSNHFFNKKWPQKELDGLVSREDGKDKVILPIWHGVTRADVVSFSPTLADKLAADTKDGLQKVVEDILKVIRPS